MLVNRPKITMVNVLMNSLNTPVNTLQREHTKSTPNYPLIVQRAVESAGCLSLDIEKASLRMDRNRTE